MTATKKTRDERTYAEKLKIHNNLKTEIRQLLKEKNAPMSLDEIFRALRSKKSNFCYKGDVRYAVIFLLGNGLLRLNKDNDVVVAD